MSEIGNSRLIGLLRRVLLDCRRVYVDSAHWLAKRHPTLIGGKEADFVRLMDDLHRGLLVKVYVTMVRADNRWTGPEKLVAATMIEHLWGEKLKGSALREAATGLFEQADKLTWQVLVNPFVRHEPLANARSQVETVVMRLANLVAKCDGQTMPEESDALHELQHELDSVLYPVGAAVDSASEAPPAELLKPPLTQSSGPHAQAGTSDQNASRENKQSNDSSSDPPSLDQEERLRNARVELYTLIGLRTVKERVKSYTNFLRLQQQRRETGLSTMPISLHMVFMGNPGTGKTTVARIMGQILGAMGTLSSGHVVETDRSGLVAEYAGQTATKTNQLIDSARGGVLFIDEAYSLVDASGDDAYGREAVQTLLKRMEDDRDDLVVILAGYTDEMGKMLESNPGLKSRINTKIEFEDYLPEDLGRIFEVLCNQNQYEISAEARHRLLLGFHHLYENRDRHFGNGRLVRNAFEDTVRRLADRVAEVAVLSEDLLTSLTRDDVTVPGLSQTQLTDLSDQPHRLKVRCQGCQKSVTIEPASLGRKVRCRTCKEVQPAMWAHVQV